MQFHLLSTQPSISKMVNWTDPSVIIKDYLALIKLNHVVAGIYIWETVFTAGFELDVLRRKRRYTWSIWLYLGTRYTALTTIVLFLVGADGGKVSCQPYTTTMASFEYASWEFASLVIVLRVQVIPATQPLDHPHVFPSRTAIWNRTRIVSTLAVGLWLAGLGLNIHSLTLIKAFSNPSQQTCIVVGLDKNVVSAVGVLVIDVVLIMSMLIGLLRNANWSSTGIWYILYQHCFIWIALAVIAEVPLVVFLILNLNDAWNEMFGLTSIAILFVFGLASLQSVI
ncbi:hypothetical protein BJV78DRAFT_1286696 [Lactifluus subvellereus]|nr:hypothetical protein BJV78DRAFT_1286696 [Lactifluus subvellereus]